MVPLNDQDWVIDFAAKWDLRVVVVTKNYLGSLNHTFLTIEAIRRRGLSIAGLVFNGPADRQLEEFVARRVDLPILLRVGDEQVLNRQVIADYAKTVMEGL